MARPLARSGRWIPGALLAFGATVALAGQGHDAGYRWALARGIDDPADCREAAVDACIATCMDEADDDDARCEADCDD